MAKKTKINSTNPKYIKDSEKSGEVIIKTKPLTGKAIGRALWYKS
tara:strand:- start:530 stop:664 length:135 start_codon:yes stop_codon:yes gene_type:complete